MNCIVLYCINPGSKSTPKACHTRNPAMSPAHHTKHQNKHPIH